MLPRTPGATPARRNGEVRPWTLSVPSLIVAGQGLVLVGLGVFLVWIAITSDPENQSNAVSMGIISAITGAGLVLCSLALWRRTRWARAPAIVWQLLTIPIGIYQIQGDLWFVGVPIVVLALVTIALLGSRRTTEALEE